MKPLASVAGWPIERLRGITGRLARENAMRKPGRTAVTAAALMIGVAMVVFVTVFAAGITSSVNGAVDRNLQGDVFIQNTDGFSPIPAAIAPEVRRIDGVGQVSSIRFGTAKVRGVSGAGGSPASTPARSPTCSRSSGRTAADDMHALARPGADRGRRRLGQVQRRGRGRHAAHARPELAAAAPTRWWAA